jgi:glycosyltransferase involved in cell wall biosynthesis
MSERPIVQVYLITHRRSHLLRRAIISVLNQTYGNFKLKIVNDAPDDLATFEVIESFHDPRLSLFLPVAKRGPTRNFNLAFEEAHTSYVSLLEDDNWWEPTFLEEMYRTLTAHPEASVVVGNERIWREVADGSWHDTGKTIWDFDGEKSVQLSIEDICGHAQICNSAMLVRLAAADDHTTPNEIPVDVTEHFRERTFSDPIVRMGKPLVNYAETINTARLKGGSLWGSYQCLLIGSVFMALSDRRPRRILARKLWRQCPSNASPRAVTLVTTGFLMHEARDLVWSAPVVAIARFLLWGARRPLQLQAMLGLRNRYKEELHFLMHAPLTQRLVKTAFQ